MPGSSIVELTVGGIHFIGRYQLVRSVLAIAGRLLKVSSVQLRRVIVAAAKECLASLAHAWLYANLPPSPMSCLWRWSVSFLLLSLCVAQNTTCDNGCDHDPILQYRPNFARSLPVQILLTGVVLTLVAVLMIHLIFTVQYHWPLAPVNYILQLSGVSTLLISLVATLHVVLAQSMRESRSWPYMLSYIAVDIPPLTTNDDDINWTPIGQATWLVMNATTSGLIQVCCLGLVVRFTLASDRS
jgi:hypothetical protein